MTQKELQKQLSHEYDRIIVDTVAELKRTKPLTKAKLAEALMKANKAYWAARLAILDTDTVFEAECTAMALSVPYISAMDTFASRVRNIYANYSSAFSFPKKDMKELLEKVVYDRSIADNLKAIAENMADIEEKERILAEISAPAYRYRLQRAESLAEQAEEVCADIARGEISTDRVFLQTQSEKAYNITVDEALGKAPAGVILDRIEEPVKSQSIEMPRAETSVQDFTPTTDKGVLDSFSLTSSRNVSEIVNRDWSSDSFSSRIWNNTEELAKEVKQVLIEGELTGASEADMAAKIAERFEVGMNKARRVVRTESNYCTNQAELKGLQDAGFDKFQFLTVEEEDVCDVCDSLNGMIFNISEAAVGVNMPPLHPFCRCRISSPEQTEEDIQREIDDIIDSWNIPEGMSLDEFIDRVNNGELEQIRAEQAEKVLTNDSDSGIIHKENEDFIFEDRKITGYMLCPGKEHYGEFVAVGYSKENPQKLYDDITSAFRKDELIYDGKNKGGNDRYYQNVTLGVTKEKPFLVGYETKEGNLRLVTCHRIGDD